jgi:branched-chain amino acid transport system ATP-binding protein
LLEADYLNAGYGKRQVLFGPSLNVHEGETVCLIGPNGSGKSTILKVVAGLVRLSSGNIRLGGESIRDWATADRVRAGVGLVPQSDNTFDELLVSENLEIGAYGLDRQHRRDSIQSVLDFFPMLQKILGCRARQLSGGERQMLAIGRALVRGPRLLLLDEPSLGLAPFASRDMLKTLRAIQEASRVGVLIVEQKVREVLNFSDRVYCLKDGKVVDQGISQDFIQDIDRTRRLFL